MAKLTDPAWTRIRTAVEKELDGTEPDRPDPPASGGLSLLAVYQTTPESYFRDVLNFSTNIGQSYWNHTHTLEVPDVRPGDMLKAYAGWGATGYGLLTNAYVPGFLVWGRTKDVPYDSAVQRARHTVYGSGFVGCARGENTSNQGGSYARPHICIDVLGWASVTFAGTLYLYGYVTPSSTGANNASTLGLPRTGQQYSFVEHWRPAQAPALARAPRRADPAAEARALQKVAARILKGMAPPKGE